MSMWISLDGFVAGPKGEMDWVTGIFDEQMGKYEDDLINTVDTLLLGRVTYQGFARLWPKAADDPKMSREEKEYARKLNAVRKVVVTKTLKKLPWENSEIIKGMGKKEIEALKQGKGKDILIYGSASLVRKLMSLELIDEYQILIYPVAIGKGKRLFGGGKKLSLKLLGTKSFNSGVVLVRYQRR